MANILDVHTLPRGERSRTRKLRDAFLAGYREAHADANVNSLDLAKSYRELPAFDEWDIDAKFEMAYGEGKLSETGAARWNTLTRLTDQLHMADVVVITTPMWNFSVPWHLKRWIDCVVQTGLTFEYADGDFRGLLAGRTGVVLTTRDGAYAQGSPYAAVDYQVPYLSFILGFLGIAPVHVVVGEPMVLQGPEVGRKALEDAIDRSRELGRSL